MASYSTDSGCVLLAGDGGGGQRVPDDDRTVADDYGADDVHGDEYRSRRRRRPDVHGRRRPAPAQRSLHRHRLCAGRQSVKRRSRVRQSVRLSVLPTTDIHQRSIHRHRLCAGTESVKRRSRVRLSVRLSVLPTTDDYSKISTPSPPTCR